MRHRVFVLFAALFICLGAAEARAVYIGDIITLEITSGAFSREQLEEKFKDFEIVELERTTEGYTLSLRTFEPGLYTVVLGDKNIELEIRSALQDIEREGLFEAEFWFMETGFVFPWHIVLYVSAGVFVLSGLIVLIKIIIEKKKKPLSPMENFLRRMNGLRIRDENCLVKLTFYFKAYIGDAYRVLIVGKTSTEIMMEIKDIPSLGDFMDKINIWLTECDRLKFSGQGVTSDKAEGCYINLLELIKKIDTYEVNL